LGLAELQLMTYPLAVATIVAASTFGRTCVRFWWIAPVTGLLCGLVVWFFRDPERVIPTEPGLIVSPADGKVVEITKVPHDDFIGGPAVRIGIFLSIFNVHLNRSPVAARVIALKYSPGGFLSATRPESAIHNENTLDLYFGLGRRLGRLLYEGKWYDPEALMLREALTRWVATAVTGSVTVELRRGDDWTLVATKAQYMSYAPEKLSMERVEEPSFTPEDRIGALEMQNLAVGDNRDLLVHHLDALRRLGAAASGPKLGALLGAGDEDEEEG